jgi:O-antigen/teichoic acid export membrane protein
VQSRVQILSFKSSLGRLTPGVLTNVWDRLVSSPVAHRLARGAFWSLAGTVFSRSLGLISSIIVARMLGKQGFGELGIIYSTVGMFATFAGFGLGMTATKHVAEYRSKEPDRAGRIIGLSSLVAWVTGSLMALALVLNASSLAKQSLAAPHLEVVLRLSAPLLLLGAVNGAQVGALIGFEAFRSIARINLISGLATFPLMIAGVYLWGVAGAVSALVIVEVFNTLLNLRALHDQASRMNVPINYANCLVERAVLWRFSVPAMLSNIMIVPVMWCANVFLVNTPHGYQEMATFSAANRWRELVLFLPYVVIQALLPIFSSTINEDEGAGSFQTSINLAQSLIVIIAFPFCSILMSFSDWLMQFYWKTSTFESNALIGCVFASLIACLGATTGTTIQARSKIWLGFVFNLSWGAIYLIFCYLLVNKLGALALAFGQVFAYILLTIWGFLYIRYDLPQGMLNRVFLGLSLACLMAGLYLSIPTGWRIWLGIPVTICVLWLTAKYLVSSDLRDLFHRNQL